MLKSILKFNEIGLLRAISGNENKIVEILASKEGIDINYRDIQLQQIS